MSELRLFATGGTIDKQYDELTGELVFGKETIIPKMLEQARIKGGIALTTLMLKDSLEMTAYDRDIIVDACLTANEDRVVVTHGTDTMAVSAREVHKFHLPRTIVFTGAMVPYSFGQTSDALFNLGMAIAYARSAPTGTYIAMNGQLFDADNVRKDKVKGIFKTIR